MSELKYTKNAGIKEVLEDALETIDPSEDGFEYVIGKILGGELKLVFEPNLPAFDSQYTDGVDGFGLCSVVEVDEK